MSWLIDAEELDRAKVLSIWTTIVKTMGLHRHQIVSVLQQQKAAVEAQGVPVPDEQIGKTLERFLQALQSSRAVAEVYGSWCCAEQAYRGHFEELLQEMQTQVLKHYRVSDEAFEAGTMRYKDDPEVSAIVAELESLYLGQWRPPSA